MMKSFITLLMLLLGSFTIAQTSNHAFETSKGTWHFPIANVQTVDTIMKDCLGVPSNSFYLILKSHCPQQVRAIQVGIVQATIEMDGVYFVMIKSGAYFLIYFGLSKPYVKKGDIVQQDSIIGILAKEADAETYDLSLLLLKGSKTLNINRWFEWKTVHNIST